MMICLDTNILIWGVRCVASPGREDMVPKARALIEQMERRKERVLIAAPSLCEYLADSSDYVRELKVIEKQFIVGAFNTPAAVMAAQLHRDREEMKSLMQEHGIQRQQFKIDTMILATAMAYGAETLITNDEHFVKLPQNRVKVIELPNDGKYFQESLF